MKWREVPKFKWREKGYKGYLRVLRGTQISIFDFSFDHENSTTGTKWHTKSLIFDIFSPSLYAKGSGKHEGGGKFTGIDDFQYFLFRTKIVQLRALNHWFSENFFEFLATPKNVYEGGYKGTPKSHENLVIFFQNTRINGGKKERTDELVDSSTNTLRLKNVRLIDWQRRLTRRSVVGRIEMLFSTVF